MSREHGSTGSVDPVVAHTLFSIFDADGDGIVTQDEIDALIPENQEHREIANTKKKGVLVGVFVDYILGEIADEAAFVSLFATIFNIISFFILCIALLSHHEVYSVQEAIEQDMVNHANFAYVEAAGWGALANQTNTIGLNTMYDVGNVAWPPISNALTREKAKEISKSVFPFSRTF